MADKGRACRVCGKRFHWCSSCGYDKDLHPLSEGFCSWECSKAGGGTEYSYDDQEDDDAEASETPVRFAGGAR